MTADQHAKLLQQFAGSDQRDWVLSPAANGIEDSGILSVWARQGKIVREIFYDFDRGEIVFQSGPAKEESSM